MEKVKPKRETQKEMILLHLQVIGSITPMEALQDYGCFRLSHIIYKLRNEGFKIETETVTITNKLGGISHYAKYSLIKEDENES